MERRKSCAQDTVMSVASSTCPTPAQRPADQYVARRSMAASSSSMTVTRVATSASTLKKLHRTGAKQRRIPPICVKLAEERMPIEQSDSDSSCYDSFNEMETGSYKFSIYIIGNSGLINKIAMVFISVYLKNNVPINRCERRIFVVYLHSFESQTIYS